jgi:hypothetical protein
MKHFMKNPIILPLLGVVSTFPGLLNAEVLVTIDSSNPLGAFMVCNELPENGGAYVFADNWSHTTASGNYSDADTIVLGPEQGAYDSSPDVNFWREDGVGPLGNKEMEASVFVNDDSLVGEDVSFTFTVDSNTFTEHTTVAFIKIFDKDYNILNQVEEELTTPGYYSLSIPASLTGVAGALHAQYGFTTVGINSSAAQAPSYGTMVISAAEPQPTATWGGYLVELDDQGKAWVNTGEWLGYLYVESAPWIYISDTGSWTYMIEPDPEASGAWTYFTN